MAKLMLKYKIDINVKTILVNMKLKQKQFKTFIL